MADHTHLCEDSELQRKWVSFFVFCGLCTLGYAATIKWEAAGPEYATYGGLLLAGLSIYFGANLGNKWVVRRGGVFAAGGDDIPPAEKK